MALLSTFELLVKPQFPKSENIPDGIPDTVKDAIGKLSRTVIQGYFLTISNLEAFDVTISLVFTVVLPTNVPNIKDLIDSKDIVGLIDVNETSNLNPFADIEPDFAPNKVRFTRTIPTGDTGLLIIQPNVLNPVILTDAAFEIRGYVEVFISSLSTGYKAAKLLLTPEHRGTFFSNLNEATFQLDQIAYSLPTAHGGSLFELSF